MYTRDIIIFENIVFSTSFRKCVVYNNWHETIWIKHKIKYKIESCIYTYIKFIKFIHKVHTKIIKKLGAAHIVRLTRVVVGPTSHGSESRVVVLVAPSNARCSRPVCPKTWWWWTIKRQTGTLGDQAINNPLHPHLQVLEAAVSDGIRTHRPIYDATVLRWVLITKQG